MNLIDKIKNKIIKKMAAISSAEALDLFIEASNHPWGIMAAASEIREHFKGKEIQPLRHYQRQIRQVL